MSESGVDRLLAVMRRLRDPDGGCPWDVEQTFATIAPYTIEEAYEVADAIERKAWDELPDELGDLLLQVAYHARMAEEAGLFDFDQVAHGIADKMIRRHPHVFGDQSVEDSSAQRAAWERTKEAERRARSAGAGSVLDDVPRTLPALQRAVRLQKRAAWIGFDWPAVGPVLDKLDEELRELREAVATADERAAQREELGDLLFVLANLARHLDLDPEDALRGANAKFERRFRAVEEAALRSAPDRERHPLEELDRLWDAEKAREREA